MTYLRRIKKTKTWRRMCCRLGFILTIPPYLPMAAWMGLVGWTSIADGGVAPDALREVLWPPLVWCWTMFVALGGLTTTIGALWHRSAVESAGLASLIWGVSLWGITLAVVGSGGSLVLALCLVLMCGLRLLALAKAREAKREAVVALDNRTRRGKWTMLPPS